MNTTDKMIADAVKVMEKSYSPYSKFTVGACIRTIDDQYFSGTNIENASYGLTLCAETAAIANMICHHHSIIADIVVVSGTADRCPPCGSCRQRIAEFSNSQTKIHLASHDSVIESYTIDQLLPHAFQFDEIN